MLRNAVIIGVCVMTALPSAAAKSTRSATPESPWCTTNPVQAMRGRSIQLPENRLHIVRASKQADAKQQLSDKAFVRIERREVAQFLNSPAQVSSDNIYYLVRASAYGIDENYKISGRLVADLFPMEKALQIFNLSLSRPGDVAKNFAVVVETDTEIQKVEIICLAAA
jgi:hypothetical protein